MHSTRESRTLLAIILSALIAVAAPVRAAEALPGTVLQSFAPAGNTPNAWALDDERGIVYVASARQVTAVDALSGQVEAVYSDLCTSRISNGNISGLEVTVNHLVVICANSSERSATIIDRATRAKTEVVDRYSFAVSDSGKTVVTSESEYLRITPESTGKQFVIPYGTSATYNQVEKKLVLSPDANTLAVVNGGVDLLEVSSGERIARIGNNGENVRTVRFSRDGQSLIVLSNKRVRVVRLDTLTVTYERDIRNIQYLPLMAFQLAADQSTLLLSTREILETNRPDSDSNAELITRLFDLTSSAVAPREFSTASIGITADGHRLITLRDGVFEVRGSATQNLFLKSRVEILLSVATENATVTLGGSPLPRGVDGAYSIAPFPGSYDLLVTAPGYRPYRRALRVVEGQPLSLNVALEAMRGSVRFQTVPAGATVRVGGQVRGVTPLNLENLSLGALEYSLELSDYRSSAGQVTIKDEIPRTVSETLAEVPGLRFSSVPAGASIAIDGRTLGVTPFVARDLLPGRVTFMATLVGYAPFSGRAVVPESGKGTVEIVLNRATALTLSTQPEARSLSLNPKVLELARSTLITVNGVPMLPVSVLAELTGLGVYGDSVTVTLASGVREIRLTVGEPTRTRPTLYARAGSLYAPLTTLEVFGLRVLNAPDTVIGLGDDRADLGLGRERVFTESVVAPVRVPWRAALERAIILDDAPGFAVRDLIKIVRGLGYQPETLTLTLNNRPLLRAFAPPKGYTSSLVVYRGSAYLPASLLGLLGVNNRFRAGQLELGVSGVEFALRFAAPGRVRVTTRAIVAERDASRRRAETERRAAERRAAQEVTRSRQRMDATRRLLEAATGLTTFYMGGDRWGTVRQLYDGDLPYVLVTIYLTPSASPSSWSQCTWRSGVNVVVRTAAGGGGLLYVSFQTLDGLANGSFAFDRGTCLLLSVY